MSAGDHCRACCQGRASYTLDPDRLNHCDGAVSDSASMMDIRSTSGVQQNVAVLVYQVLQRLASAVGSIAAEGSVVRFEIPDDQTTARSEQTSVHISEHRLHRVVVVAIVQCVVAGVVDDCRRVIYNADRVICVVCTSDVDGYRLEVAVIIDDDL